MIGAERFKNAVDPRQLRFADMETRKPLALEQQHSQTLAREHGGRRRAAGPTANDKHIEVLGHFRVKPLPRIL